MYNILIVDDDQNIRKGLSKIINDSFNGKFIIYEAENGFHALDMLSSHNVDVMVADIKMPLCDGLELIRIAKERKYHVKTIVLSGFDDYSLVRNALTLGAVDYLLKPVDINNFTAIIGELIKSVDEERKLPFSAESQLSSEVLEQQLLLEYLLKLSNNFNDDNIDSLFKKYMISINDYAFMCMIDINSKLYSEKSFTIRSLSQNIYSYFNKMEGIKLLQGEIENFWVFVIIHSKCDHSLLQNIGAFLKHIEIEGYKQGYDLEFVSLSQLSHQKKLCEKHFEKHFYNLYYAKSFDDEEKYQCHLEAALNYIIDNNYPSCVQELCYTFDIVNIKRPPIEEFKYEMTNWVHELMLKNNSYISIIGKYQFTENNILDAVEHSKNLSSLKNSFLSILNIYLKEIQNTTGNDDNYNIRRAKKYIQDHYNEDLTLSDVAVHICLHPNYFSSLFKAQTGVTFRDYVRNIRIEKSKKLIETTDLKIYEIAQQVGYAETTHFNRAFKEVTGISPINYKNKKD